MQQDHFETEYCVFHIQSSLLSPEMTCLVRTKASSKLFDKITKINVDTNPPSIDKYLAFFTRIMLRCLKFKTHQQVPRNTFFTRLQIGLNLITSRVSWMNCPLHTTSISRVPKKVSECPHDKSTACPVCHGAACAVTGASAGRPGGSVGPGQLRQVGGGARAPSRVLPARRVQAACPSCRRPAPAPAKPLCFKAEGRDNSDNGQRTKNWNWL